MYDATVVRVHSLQILRPIQKEHVETDVVYSGAM